MPPDTLEAHACGDHGHGYAGPKTAFLTWKIFIIFQVVVVGQFHSITPSLSVRHLENRGGGELPYEKARNTRQKI